MTINPPLEGLWHLLSASTGCYEVASNSRGEIMQSAKKKIAFLFIVAIVVACAAHGEVGGKITGVVKDQTGSVIPGSSVVITNTATGAKQTSLTDQDGVFTFPVLSVGQYQIDVTSDGFKPYRKTGLVIDIGSALLVDPLTAHQDLALFGYLQMTEAA